MNARPALCIRCAHCGAAMPVEIHRPMVVCTHCRATQQLPPATIERMRVHLAELARAEAVAQEHASAHRDTADELKSHYMVLVPCLTIVSMYLAVRLPFVAVPRVIDGSLEASWLAPEPLLVAGAIVGVIACLKGTWWYLQSREALPVAVVAPAQCPGCGGAVPVVIGSASACPFCGTRVLPDPDTVRRIEAAAAERASAAALRARSSRRWINATLYIMVPLAILTFALQAFGDHLGLW